MLSMFSKEAYRKKIREKTAKQAMRETGGMPRAAGFHRSAYHRHFEGWTEVKRVGLNGKVGIERIYTGYYYEPALDMRRRCELRLLYVLLIVGSIALYAFSAARNTYANRMLYVGIFQGLTTVVMAWLIYAVIFYIATPGRMTIGDYNTIHKPMYRAALTNALFMWATAAMSLFSFFACFAEKPYADLLCALGFAVSGALLFLIYYLEYNLEYRVQKSDADMPEDGAEIE